MKNLRLKDLHLLGLVLIFSFFSCSVYRATPGSVNEAVESDNRVRVVTTDNQVFELKNLRREGNELIGITGKHSETAKLMSHRRQELVGSNLEIRFQENDISAIYLKDKKMSRWVNFGVPVIGAAGLVGLTAKNFRPDMGY